MVLAVRLAKFARSHWSLSISLLLVKFVGLRSVLILLVKLSRSVRDPLVAFVYIAVKVICKVPVVADIC